MTEKRFTHRKWYNERQLFDGEEPFAIVDIYIQSDKICDKLNELAEENKQLKQSYTKLEHRHSLLHDECLDAECDRDSYCKDVLSLEKENEDLKKELKRCKDWLNSDKNDYELTLAFIKNKGYSLKDVLEYEKELKSE